MHADIRTSLNKAGRQAGRQAGTQVDKRGGEDKT